MNTIFKRLIYSSKKKILTEIDNLKIKINSYNLKILFKLQTVKY